MSRRTRSNLLRVATHLGALLPLAILVWDYQTHNLTVNPIQAAEQRSGDIALVLLLISLACTPLNTLFGFSEALKRRRALGLYAFGYACLHLLIFAGLDYGLDWGLLGQAIVEKPFILVGFSAFLILVLLAVTSFRWWMKRLGQGWRRLHRWVYLAGVLAMVHFAWQIKGDFLRLSGDVRRPLLYALILAFLLIVRLPPLRRAISNWRQKLKWQMGKSLKEQSSFTTEHTEITE